MILNRKDVPELETLIQGLIRNGLPNYLPYANGLNFDRGTGPDWNTDRTDVYLDGQHLSVHGGEDTRHCRVSWTVTIKTQTGLVTATPFVRVFNHTKNRDESNPETLARLGFTPRELGTLGPLELLFSNKAEEVCRTYNLPNLWMRREDAIIARS